MFITLLNLFICVSLEAYVEEKYVAFLKEKGKADQVCKHKCKVVICVQIDAYNKVVDISKQVFKIICQTSQMVAVKVVIS